MTLPTIIIAGRAAVQAVPPSIRDAALGVGASKMQTIMHHVLPLAMPGMLTGAIIGMARRSGRDSAAVDDRHGGFYRGYPRRVYRSGHSAAGPGFFVGGQSGTRVCGADVGGYAGIAGIFVCHERSGGIPAKTF